MRKTGPGSVDHADSSAEMAARVRLSIGDSGMSQRQIARHIGLDETKLSKGLRGLRRFSAAEITALATITGVTANWLITGSDTGEGHASVPAPAVMMSQAMGSSGQDRRRREIIDKAWQLFAAQGFDAVRIADIAAAAQTSSATVHYYYATKDELFAEALRYSVKLAFDRQISELAETEDIGARLRRLVQLQLPKEPTVHAEWSIWIQTWARLAVGQGARSQHNFAYDRWQQTVRAVIAEGQDRGVICSTNSSEELTLSLTALIDGLGVKVMTRRLTADHMLEHIDRHIVQHILVQDRTTHELHEDRQL